MYYNKEKDQQEELYSQQVNAGKRKYYFDVKETRSGDQFITITESRKMFDNNSGTFYYDRNKMFLYKEDFEKFQQALQNAFNYIETGVMAPSENDNEPHDSYHYEDRRPSRYDRYDHQDRHNRHYSNHRNNDYDNHRSNGYDSQDDFAGTFDDFHINEI